MIGRIAERKTVGAPRSAKSELVAELCRKHPEATTIGLARRLAKEHPALFASVEAARSAVRLQRGANGNMHRELASVPRQPGKAGYAPSCPPSFADTFEPFELKGTERLGVISDIHVPYHCEKAWEAAVNSLKGRIDTLLINGDYIDCYQVSHWEKKPTKRRFKEELDSSIAGLRWMRESFPKARIVLKLGNHDERWEKFVWNRAPEIYDLPQCQIESILELDKLGIECVKDQRVVLAGKLPILHGHELQKGIAAPVNAARGCFLRTNHSLLVGHSHRTSTHVEPDMFGREVAVWSTGMLCAQNPEYNRFAKSNWGFAYVHIEKDGEFSVENYRISKDWKVRTS